jgi:hypothetical protein
MIRVLFLSAIVWMMASEYVGAVRTPSGIYFFSDAGCQTPVSIEPNGDPADNFLPVVNTLNTNYSPYVGQRLSTVNCLTLECHFASGWEGASVEPTSYNPKQETVWAIMGGGQNPTPGLCDAVPFQGQQGFWDLSCSDRGNGTYVYLDCFGAMDQFPPGSWAPPNYDSSSTGSQDAEMDLEATVVAATEMSQSDLRPREEAAVSKSQSSFSNPLVVGIIILSIVSALLLLALVAVVVWVKHQRVRPESAIKSLSQSWIA